MFELTAPRSLDQRFHVTQVTLEHAASLGRQAVLGLRDACGERLATRDVARLFQLTPVRAQVAVARLQKLLELVERHALVNAESTHDAQSNPLVDEAIEILRLTVRDVGAYGTKPAQLRRRLLRRRLYCPFSHRASVG